MRKVNGWLAFAWLFVGVGGVALSSVRESIPVLFFISVYANVAGHWAGWQAARTEEAQAGATQELIRALLAQTNVEPAPGVAAGK